MEPENSRVWAGVLEFGHTNPIGSGYAVSMERKRSVSLPIALTTIATVIGGVDPEFSGRLFTGVDRPQLA
jgi:hypothetical protein